MPNMRARLYARASKQRIRIGHAGCPFEIAATVVREFSGHVEVGFLWNELTVLGHGHAGVYAAGSALDLGHRGCGCEGKRSDTVSLCVAFEFELSTSWRQFTDVQVTYLARLFGLLGERRQCLCANTAEQCRAKDGNFYKSDFHKLAS